VTISPTSTADPFRPTRIHADRAARTLEIDWSDGHHTVYDFDTLRWLCPCAYCRGEAGLPGWLDSAPALSPEQTRMVDIAIVGQYAVAPTWGDGHHTGYYTYQVLRDRCPCAECSARRAAAGERPALGSGHLAHTNAPPTVASAAPSTVNSAPAQSGQSAPPSKESHR
jgi:DUF971 family protein